MANVRKILRMTEVVIPTDRNGDEVEVTMRPMLVEFNPPICAVCHQEMKNINTVEGKRRYQCMTWECTNRRLYDQEGNQHGKDSRNEQKSAA